LIAVAVIYFVMGQNNEAYFMLAAIVVVSGISFYQDNRSRIAMEALEKLNEPLSTVLRNGEPIRIATAAIVIDDLVIAEEEIQLMEKLYTAMISPLMNLLTGEPYAVFKSENRSKVHI
jgi:Ca2+-transporting ATPase